VGPEWVEPASQPAMSAGRAQVAAFQGRELSFGAGTPRTGNETRQLQRELRSHLLAWDPDPQLVAWWSSRRPAVALSNLLRIADASL
jgi:hypothetical protein